MKNQNTHIQFRSPFVEITSIFIAGLLLTCSLSLMAAKGGKGKQGGDKGKPGGGGDTTTSAGPCLTFLGFGGATLLSDDGTPYCNNNKAKIQVVLSNDGKFSFDSNNSNKSKAGRDVFIQFDNPIHIYDVDGNVIDDPSNPGNPLIISSTADLDARGIHHDINMHIGAFEANFNMFNLQVGEEVLVNLSLNLFLRNLGAVLVIKMAPNPIDNDRHSPGTDIVLMTRLADENGKRKWSVNSYSLELDADGNDLGVGSAVASVSHNPFVDSIRTLEDGEPADQASYLNFRFEISE